MPFCKNCHSRISKFDSDRCPVCGTINPLEDATSDTVEITTNIERGDDEFKASHPGTKKALLIYFCACGFTGVPFYYLKNKLLANIWLFFNAIMIALLVSIFFFAAGLHIAVAFLIAFAINYVFNSIVGVVFYFIPNLKDKEGVYLR